MIEEVSVFAADKRRKEPRQVKRPFDTSSSAQPTGLVTTPDGGKTAYGHDAMLAMFASKVRPANPPSDTGEGATGV